MEERYIEIIEKQNQIILGYQKLIKEKNDTIENLLEEIEQYQNLTNRCIKIMEEWNHDYSKKI